jgi:hypothetical protein
MALFELWVGDIYEELATMCQSQHKSAILIDQSNLDHCLKSPPEVAYTSLADIGGIQNLLYLCRTANHIHYYPPRIWSDQLNNGKSQQKYWTEYVLKSLTDQIKITGSDIIEPDHDLLRSDMLLDHRCTDTAQGWAVGCSVTSGTGVEIEQTWHRSFFNTLKLQYSLLAKSGSSIIWQSDQICRSDLRKGDVVAWAITSPERRPLFDNNKLTHVTVRAFERDPSLLDKISPDDLTSTDLLYQNVMAVRRAYNYCLKAGADLLVLGVLYDFQGVLHLAGIPNSRPDLIWPETFEDLGSDGEHPGPQHHKNLAKKFFLMYNKTIVK